MRIIITGGSGLIGRALIEVLTKSKHEVVVLSRSPEWVVGLPAGAQAVAWDGKTAGGWADLINENTAIVNLAGESIAGENPLGMRWTASRKKSILNSRLNAGKAVTQAVQQAAIKPKVLIQTSAVGYYGPRNGEELSETAAPGNDFLASVCAQWEESTKPVEAAGVRRAVIRIGIVLSTAGGALPLQMLPFQFFAGGPIGSGNQYYPWIHIVDLAEGIRFLIETESAAGVFNLCAPNPVTNKAFGEALGQAMGRPAFIPAPGFAFKLAFGEAATLLLDGQRTVPTRLVEAGYKFKFSELQPALDNLIKQ